MDDPLDQWAMPVATVSSAALARIVDLVGGITVDTLPSTLAEIRQTAERALAFDPERLRLRFDDPDGNRSFVQRVDGIWRAFRHDGREVQFEYCFGRPCNPGAIIYALSQATTIHEVETIACKNIRGLQNVQVEAVWELHRHAGDHLGFIPATPLQRAG